MYLLYPLLVDPGPVLSQFDRFFLIGPRAKGGPALRLLTKAKLHFLSKLLVYSAGAGPSVFCAILRDQIDHQIFPTVSQNTVQTHFSTTIKVHQILDL